MTRQLSCPSTDTGWQDMFLTALRQTGNVSAAARAAGVARSRCYEVRRRDPDFATGWQDALEEAADWLEFEALRRAVEGTEEDRFFGGHIVGQVTRYSDALLMFLLKARRPGGPRTPPSMTRPSALSAGRLAAAGIAAFHRPV